jgi:protein-disulfide isomerase
MEQETQNNLENTSPATQKPVNNTGQIAGAIIVAGFMIAGAILLRGNTPSTLNADGVKLADEKKMTKAVPVFSACLDSGKYAQAVADTTNGGRKAGVSGTPKGFILKDGKVVSTIDGALPFSTVKVSLDNAIAGKSKVMGNINLEPITSADFVLGNPEAKVAVVVYEDFQCPFCDRFVQDSEKNIRDNYLKDGTVQLVYRDFAFLGPESTKASEAARCAGEQGKFWEYHDYLYSHQNGENRGAFANANLKAFAKELKLK